MKIPVVLSWSGGKDSAMALHELSRHADYEVVGLLTTVSDEYKRISHHGVREELLDLQAAAIGLALDKIYLPSSNSHPCMRACRCVPKLRPAQGPPVETNRCVA